MFLKKAEVSFQNFHMDFLRSRSSELSGHITKAWPKPVDLGIVGTPER